VAERVAPSRFRHNDRRAATPPMKIYSPRADSIQILRYIVVPINQLQTGFIDKAKAAVITSYTSG
jgi:hypothetical protein